ncbi:MAG TPA: ATP-binding protein [Bacteroidia bacterium]|nr:ATP-binding protein [Bacteroidia bacterium]HNU32896.1 ATP-binding protein [Bacteroidia bacterium]
MQLDKKLALGFVNFDSGVGSNNEVEIRIPFDKLKELSRGKYVIIPHDDNGYYYLARITRGPFFTPDAVSRESAFAKASIVQAGDIAFIPDYHGIGYCELIGLFHYDSSHLSGVQTRPHPKSPVFNLPPDKIQELLKLKGNMYLGHLSGYEGIRVYLDAKSKVVLPRNIGIFGTVGSGKTNSSQVLIEEAAAAGWAVVVLDVEGEYISMDKPNSEIINNPGLKKKADQYQIIPEGLKSFQVYHPANTDSKREDSLEFSIPFGSLSPYELSAIMGMNDTQADNFTTLWDKQVADIAVNSTKPKNPKNQWKAIDENKFDDDPEYPDLTIESLLTKLNKELEEQKGSSKSSFLVVKRLLGRLKRFGIFDSTDDLIDTTDLLKPGKVSVLDLSNSYTVQVNNIVIAYLLRKLFDQKIKHPELPPTMIFIEEAHTFVSKENASKMEALLDRLREVTRRGRKRWLGLCFISQQPSHLPEEIFELCNTKIIHQTTGNRNLNALKISGGNVNEAIWDDVPTLGQGRSIIISPQYQHPIMTNMRICKTNREHTD